MVWQLSPLRTAMGWCEGALQALENRFTIRKNAFLFHVRTDDEAEIFWRVIAIVLWILCFHMRRYDVVLRGCSPIVVETIVPLLRVICVVDETMRREEMTSLSCLNCMVRLNNGTPAVARNSLTQQKRKERVGPRTAFIVELFVWFTIIFLSLDVRNIHRLSVALFVVSTIHWARFGFGSAACLLVLYLLVTYFWLPSYSLRDTFLALSGQRSWVYTIYASYSLAFSLTLLISDTQFLQHTRREFIWKVLKVAGAFERNLMETPLKSVFAFLRLFFDYFFFLGFNFGMALCMWFSTLMFEWAFTTSCTGLLSSVGIYYIIFGGGWGEDFQKALREGIICFIAYLLVITFVIYFIPVHSLSFASNCVSSGFFVLYTASFSPRRIHSTGPLALVWLFMVAVDASWQVHHTALNMQHIAWYKRLLYANTIAFGWLFFFGTILDMYDWGFLSMSSSTSTITVSGITTKTVKNEHRQKEKPAHTPVPVYGERPNGTTHSITTTLTAATTRVTPVLRKLCSSEEAEAIETLPSVSPPVVLRGVESIDALETGITTADPEERDSILENPSSIAPPSQTDKHMSSSSRVDTVLVMDKHIGIDVSENQGIAAVLLSEEGEGEEVEREETPVKETEEDIVLAKDDGEHSSNHALSEYGSSTLFAAKDVSAEILQSSASSIVTRDMDLDKKEMAAPFSAVRGACSTVLPSQRMPLSASPQPSISSASSTERRSGELNNRRALQNPDVVHGSSRKESKRKSIAFTELAATATTTTATTAATAVGSTVAGSNAQPSVKDVSENATKVVNIPLPRGMRTETACAPSASGALTVIAASTEVAAKAVVTTTEASVLVSTEANVNVLPVIPQSAQRRVSNAVVNRNSENAVGTSSSKQVVPHTPEASVSSQSLALRTSGPKVMYKELNEAERIPKERNTVHMDVVGKAGRSVAASASLCNSTGSGKSTVEASGAVATADGALSTRVGPSQGVERGRHTGYDVREIPSLAIPQPRSTRFVAPATVAATSPSLPPAAASSATAMTATITTTATTTTTMPTLTGTAIDNDGNLLSLRTVLPKRTDIPRNVLASLLDDGEAELSSHGDDDAVLDLARPHLVSYADSDDTLLSESARAIPLDARHALENFARSWTQPAGGSNSEEVRGPAATAVTAAAALAVNTKQQHHHQQQQQQHQQHQMSGNRASHAYSKHRTTGGSHMAQVAPIPIPGAPVMFASEEHKGINASVYPYLGLNPPQHMTPYPQTQVQQHVPMMLLQTGDGRVAFYPIVTPSQSPVHVIVPASHIKQTTIQQQQQQQQQTLVFPQVALPSQQVYSANWPCMQPPMNPNR